MQKSVILQHFANLKHLIDSWVSLTFAN